MAKVLGHYRIVSRLGAGGMGEVYLATDTRLNRKVAIKMLPPNAIADDTARSRLLREARAAATIDHPNVCAMYDVVTEGAQPYIVMQYVEGETLLERMQRARIELPETIDLARQITAALSQAHAHGVVHRDVKPGNIIIGSSGLVKVLDFGLAKWFAPSADSETTLSAVGMIAGTTPYMSPEQLRAEPLDGRSDIFSLGVVLYEIATNQRPFDRSSVAATIAAILTEDPPPVDGPLQPLIVRALAKSRSQRFASADDMHAALTALTAEPTRGSRPRATEARRVTARAVDPETERLYLRGRAQWNKRHPEAVRQAILSFQEAVERDPLFAPGHAGLADAYVMLGFLQSLPPRDIIPKAKAAARRAIELEPGLAEPHATLGYMAGIFDWDWEAAKHALVESMRLNPSYSWAPHWYGILASSRSVDEAVEYLTRARDLDPLSPITNVAVGLPLHLNRRYHEAMRIYSDVIQSQSTFAPAHYYIGLSYEQLGDYGAALAHLRRAVDISSRGSLFVGALGHCLGVAGDHDEARRLLDELEERSRDRYVSPYNVMLVHLGLGAYDVAFPFLERAFEERNSQLWMTPVEPRFDALRGNPEFRALVGRYGVGSEA
jgi:tetratricopeptide (TPR) repeat protein/tRNA A-37 threonylcarbamoyl transferase component Bud32